MAFFTTISTEDILEVGDIKIMLVKKSGRKAKLRFDVDGSELDVSIDRGGAKTRLESGLELELESGTTELP